MLWRLNRRNSSVFDNSFINLQRCANDLPKAVDYLYLKADKLIKGQEKENSQGEEKSASVVCILKIKFKNAKKYIYKMLGIFYRKSELKIGKFFLWIKLYQCNDKLERYSLTCDEQAKCNQLFNGMSNLSTKAKVS